MRDMLYFLSENPCKLAIMLPTRGLRLVTRFVGLLQPGGPMSVGRRVKLSPALVVSRGSKETSTPRPGRLSENKKTSCAEGLGEPARII